MTCPRGADTEWCSADWESGHGLALARNDVISYWRSNPHKSGIIDIVQIDNGEFEWRKEFEIGQEMSTAEEQF